MNLSASVSMQSPLRAKTARGPVVLSGHSRSGFTLIELILVLTLLVIIVSIVTPRLTEFMGGRGLDSEVRRFVAMTHYAQSRAVSEGIPMLLWVDTKANSYGLMQEAGYSPDTDPKADTYKVAEVVKINVSQTGGLKGIGKSRRVGIHFSPDGNAITNSSVSGVSFQVGKQPAVWVMASDNGFTYEVQQNKSKISSLRR